MILLGRPRLSGIQTATDDESLTISEKEKILYIPKIIHQTWKNTELPKVSPSYPGLDLLFPRQKFKDWSDSFKTNHPTWEHKLWTDEDNRAFIAREFPWFLKMYDGFQLNILRIDSVRYLYMYKYGGIYADLDVESVKPSDDTLKGLDGAVLTMLGDNLSWEHSTPNSWMASVKGHPFWMHCLAEVMKIQPNDVYAKRPEMLTGYPFISYRELTR